MKIVQTVDELRKELKKFRDKEIGLVPTMGYLHEGHTSLLSKAQKECDCVVLSIFINPLQFGENEDIEVYPRNLCRDIEIAKNNDVSILFCPREEDIYPEKNMIEIKLNQISSSLCGISRPGHFEGVALIVMKLFNLVMPQRAYFGIKDAQQVAAIKQIIKDLNYPISVVPCPTVREVDGLAKSSRNVYLKKEERKQAKILFQALNEVEEKLVRNLFQTTKEINNYLSTRIKTQPLAEVIYIDTLTYPGLKHFSILEEQTIIIALAVRFGNTRLIDNLIFNLKERLRCFAQ